MDSEHKGWMNRSKARIALGITVIPAIALAVWALTLERATRRIASSAPPIAGGLEPVIPMPASFPRTELVEGLLDEPVTLPKLPGGSDKLLASRTWTDGTPILLRGAKRRYEALGSDLATLGAIETDDDLSQIVELPTPHGRTQWIAIADRPDSPGRDDSVIGIDASGSTTWRWNPSGRYVHSIAITFDSDRASGVIVGVGGEQGVVGLDLDGALRWDAPKHHVAYEVRTHPSLPDRSLFVGWDRLLFDGGGRTLYSSAPRRFDADRIRLASYLTVGVILPGERGDASMILGGNRLKPHNPLLVRVDSAGREAWAARPETKIEAIELVEPPNRPRLVVATTDGGELLVVDERGGLRARVDLPGERHDGRLYQYGLAAGRLGEAGWFVAVTLLDGTRLYRLHPDRLPPK